ncbi:hypothetical protein HY745_10380 [Candidatus Desantisbacteria bacterium]|nr:hypothetical protein [Candidatus Desantisbacteria bacterium]
MKNHYIIPIFLTRQGCKSRCIFCSQEHITTKDELTQDISAKIKHYLSTIPESAKNVEAAFYGGTFTGLDFISQEKLLSQITPFIKTGLLSGIRIATRPDKINQTQIDFLKSFHVKTVELGVESMNDRVLKNSHVKMMASLLPDFVRIHPVLVLKGSGLETLYKQGKYKPLTLQKAVNNCLFFLNEMEKKNIKVIRIGLYPSDELRTMGVIIAGPFHQAFGELVIDEKFYRIITKEKEKKTYKNSILEIKSNQKDSSAIRGQHKINIKHLKKKYGFMDIKISENIKMKRGSIGLFRSDIKIT